MANIQLTKNLGLLLLGIWMVIYGIIALGGLASPVLGTLMGIFAIVVGVLLAIGK
jgi:hypothetical protein